VVALGASAGGLEACRTFLGGLQADSGLALILVQHLDPTHPSLMVELLAADTALTVEAAAEGRLIEPAHLYVIPPGAYLSIANGTLHLSPPQARHGARLPFDFLLPSLAEAYGERAVCVVLSGTGADGSLGLKAIKEHGGLVVAQEPTEAAFDGMPRSAILTGAVDLVLPAAQIAAALITYHRRRTLALRHSDGSSDRTAPVWLPEMLELLRRETGHDFSLYKPGTLQRRIERRMAMAAFESDAPESYLELLRTSAEERALLARDLLINVTSFFRDPAVFELLATTIVPELVRRQPSDQPLRLWVAGCSSGEETYSLAMLFQEQIAAAQRPLKLQLFASDLDPEAIAAAREGLYPDTIAAEVSPARLARFFTKEDNRYRVQPELRSLVVFAVQNVLADPPFSRLDFVSCRNLLIYLQPEAQAQVISLFHFALREGGILLLGNAESIGAQGDHFEVIAKAERLYRHQGRSRPGDLGFLSPAVTGARVARPGASPAPSRQAALAELCRRLVLESYAPAAVLINRKQECLYSLGPTDRYLRLAPGLPTNDLLALARESLRTTLRAAIQQATQENARVVVAGGRAGHGGPFGSFSIAVQPVTYEGEALALICFADQPASSATPAPPGGDGDGDSAHTAELEAELKATRRELQAAIRNLEEMGEEQKAITEETLSANEEYQSTNEELLTSKEELQSLNEELTALNSQLQETLERQRTTANDLQNVLYSTDVATLFLNRELKIRFFTPATRSLFRVIPSDLGRPLADLASLAADGALLSDARTVLETQTPLEREIEAQSGAWYVRRILPYRAENNRIEGVVITFTDITERRRAAGALETAKQQAEQATLAKSRFLAAASHDLRQPLQTLSLLQGLLAKAVDGEQARSLLARFDQSLGTMTVLLNTLLDINQLEAGTVRTERVSFPLNGLLQRLRDEFSVHAQAQGLSLRAVPCRLAIDSDPRLLEQMLRNLLSNALKYTPQGKILLGCRRHGNHLSIEVWDTGIGIPQRECQAIFEEYHQLDNPAREHSRGLGLGLSIVQRLGHLLGHPIRVRSRLGHGSMFAIEVTPSPGQPGSQPSGQSPGGTPGGGGALPQPPPDTATTRTGGPTAPDAAARPGASTTPAPGSRKSGSILVIEDDPELRGLLEVILKGAGHRVITTANGRQALELVAQGVFRPDLILADYNLPRDLTGAEVTARLRQTLGHEVPAIILTGDIATATLREIARHQCLKLNKPVTAEELTRTISRLLARTPVRAPAPAAERSREASRVPAGAPAGTPERPVIFIVDDDRSVREALRSVLEDDGRWVEDYGSCEDFLAAAHPSRSGCLLIDAYLPGMSGLELLHKLKQSGDRLPAIMITGKADVPMAVQAMKAGAWDFIEKPVGPDDLLATIHAALDQGQDASKRQAWHDSAAHQLADLTPRQRQIMDMVLAGHPSKNIAADLGISQRTVENHRAAIMKKTGSKSLPALARLAIAATGSEP